MKAVIRCRNDLLRWVDQVTPELQEGKPYTVSLSRFKRSRTLPQNSLFHALCGELAQHTGQSPNDIKEYVKSECGWVKTVQIGDKIKELPMPTSEMNVEQLSHLIEELYRIGADCGCVFQGGE